MSKKPRGKHTPTFKAKVALATLAGDKTLAQLTQEFKVHQNQIVDWKKQLNERAAEVFGKPAESTSPPVDAPVDMNWLRIHGSPLHKLLQTHALG